MAIDEKSELLRHFLATLGYRGQKVLASVPPNVADFRGHTSIRSPDEILKHINNVLNHAVAVLVNREITESPCGSWSVGVEQFFASLRELDESIEGGAARKERLAEKLLQGPLADVMLHLGQIGILRRMAGVPVEPEMYFEAEIIAGDIPPVA